MKVLSVFIFIWIFNFTYSQQQVDNRFIVTDRVNRLLQERQECSLKRKIKEKNFHIQIYNGYSLNKAKSIKQNFLSNFPDIPVAIEWENPEFKVWVGVFENKLSADRGLMHIKKKYPNAFIVNPKK